MSVQDYIYSFQDSPITLVGGAAGTGNLPISLIINASNYSGGITKPADAGTDTFVSFRPLPGHTLIVNEVATYPFANQNTAANAVIAQPLNISIEMILPMTKELPYIQKLALMTNLKSKLDEHTALGGYYTVATPSYVYNGCLLVSLVDASDLEDGVQPQNRFIWNFVQPLITSQQLQAAQNQTMAKITAQTQNTGSPLDPASNISATASDPTANITQNLVPSSAGSLGSNIAPSTNTGSSSSSITSTFGF